ncbi:hypothetical protein GGS21DRAFT_485905 [Xylaria nigripes]|nr:hypothetical protein GGS21DRAFT_485905 [Xylaria nigripes]
MIAQSSDHLGAMKVQMELQVAESTPTSIRGGNEPGHERIQSELRQIEPAVQNTPNQPRPTIQTKEVQPGAIPGINPGLVNTKPRLTPPELNRPIPKPEKHRKPAKTGQGSHNKQSALTKPSGIKKPSGKNKANSKKKPTKPLTDRKALEALLTSTRRWLVPGTAYMHRNPDTLCFGLSRRPAEAPRKLTIVHTETCECLDARLLHICKHVDKLVRTKQLGRRFRDDLVIAVKMRLDLPKAARLPRHGRQIVRRWESEIEAERTVINVVDTHRHQVLIEKWKNLEAFKKRRIWKDW